MIARIILFMAIMIAPLWASVTYSVSSQKIANAQTMLFELRSDIAFSKAYVAYLGIRYPFYAHPTKVETFYALVPTGYYVKPQEKKAVIVTVVDGVKDNIPGKLNPIYLPGNTVIIKTDNNEFLFFAHFIKNSIAVSEGQIVKQGDLLGLCGNSGNSSEPHLHFHIQNVEDMNEATGAKAYFKKILVDGKIKRDYSPVRNEKVRNAN